MVDDRILKKIFLWLLVGMVFFLGFLVIKPIALPIIFGLFFAYLFSPVYEAINKKINRRSISAIILILGITLLITIPLIYLIPPLFRQSFEVFATIQNYNFNELTNSFKFFQGEVGQIFSKGINNISSKTFNSFLTQLSDIFINLPGLLLHFSVFLFTFFFAIKDSRELKSYVSHLSPFSTSTGEKFLKEFRGITNAIVFGQVLIGIFQGLALGAGLYFLGVPNALMLTFLACIAGIIPVVGPWLVYLPGGLILFSTGQTTQGIFLLLYGAIFVSSVDNFLRPYLVSRQSNLPVSISLIGTIGGLLLFGIAGLLLGPLILAYILIILDFYKQGKLNELFKN